MKIRLLGLVCLLVVLAGNVNAGPYIDDEEESLAPDADYVDDNALDNLMRAAQQKRACIRRNGSCDNRRNSCCYSSSCRCNLWGQNCRCQRVGIFQKLG